MKKAKGFMMMVLTIGLYSCQKPIILKMTEAQKNDNNCEFSVESDVYYDNIEDFKKNLEKEVYKRSSKCKCDTVYVDINDIFLMREKVDKVIWGVCKSDKLFKN